MGTFAKRAAEVRKTWEDRLADQETKLRKHIPSVEEEASLEALNRIKALREKSFLAGYMARRARQQESGIEEILPKDTQGVPGREIAISLPKSAGVLDALVRPAREAAEGVKLDALQGLDEAASRGTRITNEPGTLPWYYPMAALTVPNSFAEGFQKADKDIDSEKAEEVNERLLRAQQSFEQALEEEYRARPGAKAASAGELLDGLAKTHVKCAEGELNQMLGAYLALAALLGQGSHMTAKEWVEKRDPKRQELKAVREAVRQRMRSHPPAVTVEPSEVLARTEPSLDVA